MDDAKRQEQKDFISKQLEPNLADARQGLKHVYFVDAAHFVLQPFLGFLWCFQRWFVYSAAGRQRFNVLGALNAITHEVVTITNDTYINAVSVCELLRKLAKKHAQEGVTLFLDNARYQKCKLVQELAVELKTEVSRFPQATSPITTAIRGFRVPWLGLPQSTLKPPSASAWASARRTSAKAYSVRRPAA